MARHSRKTSLPTTLALLLALALSGGCDDGTGSDDAGADADGMDADFDRQADADGNDGGSSDADTPPDASERLARHLIGHFDSSAQAATNPSYWPVQLSMCRVDAPELGGNVLYVEQAMLDTPGSPYRQRLYVIEAGETPATEAVSQVWELRAPHTVVGLCDHGDRATFDGDAATERPGCATYMTWMDDHFEGSTNGQDCESSLNGATYATSIVTLHAERMESWDRGYDGADTQVWGAVDGPYVFDRKTAMGEQ